MPLDRSIKINLHDYVWAHDGVIDEKYEVTGDVVPIVTTCDRPRSYLKHTLLGLRQEGIPDPIISMDTKQIGPVGAFLNALKVIHSNFPDKAGLVIQDDCWVTSEAWHLASTREKHNPFVFSLFRMMPPDVTKGLIGTGRLWGRPDEPFIINRDIKDKANRYNGGCLLYLTSGMINALTTYNVSAKCDDKLPQWLGQFCEGNNLKHYQVITPLAYHFGAVSSIKGRPEGHLMPINPLMEALVDELDKKFEEDDKCQH